MKVKITEIKKIFVKNSKLISIKILENINNEKSIIIFGNTYIKILQHYFFLFKNFKNNKNKKTLKLLEDKISILKKFKTKQWLNWAKEIQKKKKIIF
jgi:hypothetical protein